MKRLGIWLLGVCILALNLSAMEGGAAAMKKAGYTLLDMYVKSFQEEASRGTGSGELETNLQAMATEAKKAKEAGDINLVFYAHYARILALTKLIVNPDPGNLLMPVIDREIADFLKDVTGEDIIARTGSVAIGQVANALAEELINLQIYLDTLEKREAMRKKFDEGMTGPPKK
ncbi:MAG: hypothetical protein A2Y86_05860 [Candidatus Aminicenantes bacterium RBG_13_62_12]|nr:MAG: hypothetical protein A2Y86_05860 [Candidatus Aminicenantes bacterium RBG_13_62_12]